MRRAHLPFSCLLLCAVLAGASHAQETNATPPLPPAPPHWYQDVGHGVTLRHLSPVAYFRGLLGMTPEERDQVLAGKSEQEREQVLAKVREYEALPRDVREERLRQTELHWHVLNLLRLKPAERQAHLNEISPLYLPFVLQQLSQWDNLPSDLRQALLEKESFLRTYLQWQGHSTETQDVILTKLPANQRARWTAELSRWQNLPENKRAELSRAFQQFFYLTGHERQETIQSMSAADRQQMEQALRSYAGLSASQQKQCVDSFGKFATMSAEEQNQFLQNAAKWETMSGSERQLWRSLVNRLPPEPPGFSRSKFPPMPPGWQLQGQPTRTEAGGARLTNLAKSSTGSP